MGNRDLDEQYERINNETFMHLTNILAEMVDLEIEGKSPQDIAIISAGKLSGVVKTLEQDFGRITELVRS